MAIYFLCLTLLCLISFRSLATTECAQKNDGQYVWVQYRICVHILNLRMMPVLVCTVSVLLFSFTRIIHALLCVLLTIRIQ